MRQKRRIDRRTGVLIIALTLITAVIHISLMADLFVLNGIGYLALITISYLPSDSLSQSRRPARFTLIFYTGLTVLAYFLVHPGGKVNGSADLLGLAAKLVELVLIGALLRDAGFTISRSAALAALFGALAYLIGSLLGPLNLI